MSRGGTQQRSRMMIDHQLIGGEHAECDGMHQRDDGTLAAVKNAEGGHLQRQDTAVTAHGDVSQVTTRAALE